MIIIDAGHGGADPGASGNGIIEKDYNLNISLYLYNRLNQLNMPVSLTRDADVTLTPVNRIQEIKELGDVKGNILISNHLNAAQNLEADGAEVIYALRSTDILPNLILQEIAKTGQNIRSAYQKRLPGDSSKDFYFLMRETSNLEPIIVEYGFITSNKDDPNQIKSNWKEMAEAVVKALSIYLNIPYNYSEVEMLNIIHIVQFGDNLYDISEKNGVSAEEIMKANNLTSTILQIGQKLIIPSPNSQTTYTVQMGDSLYSIAKKFKTTVDDIKKLNNIQSNMLQIGQRLIISSQ